MAAAAQWRAETPFLDRNPLKFKEPPVGTVDAPSSKVLPITKIAIAWLAGLWLGVPLEIPPSFIVPLLGLCICVLHGCARPPPRHSGHPLHPIHLGPPLFALAAGLLTPLGAANDNNEGEIPSGLARLSVYVNNTSATHDGDHLADVVVQSGHLLSGEPFPAKTRLRLTPLPLPEGAVVSVLAQITPTTAYRNLTPHPPWIAPNSIAGWGRLPGPSSYRVISQPNSLRALLGKARQHLRTGLLRSLPADCRGLAVALLLGDRGAVSAELRGDVNAAGLSHLLAVSGLHISILAGLAMLFIRRGLTHLEFISTRFNSLRLAYGLGVPLALLISQFCGGGPSATRAATTAAIGWTLRFLGLRPTATATTACAVLCIGAGAPELVVTPGFTLSIVATAAVLQGLERTSNSQPSGSVGFLRAALRVSVLTTLVTAPITLWCFDQVPLSGIFANLIAIPWASFILIPTAVLHGILVSTSPTLGGMSAPMFVLSARVLFAISKSAAAWFPAIPWPIPNLLQGLLLAGLAAMCLLASSIRRRTWLIAVGLLLAGILVAEVHLRHSEQPNGQLRVTFLDIGQGDGAIIDMPDGSLVLIDAGGDPQGYLDPGERVILPLLKARRRDHIDLAILSHPHPDHYGGFPALLNALPVHELWDSGQADLEADLFPSPSPVVAMLANARKRSIPVHAPNTLCKQPRHFGDATLTVLHPCPMVDHGLSENDNSLVILLEYGTTRILFSGDIEADSETRLLAEPRLRNIDVLKVGHHGSRTSSTTAFLSHTSPKLAVISAGRNNRFGHPHPQVSARFLTMRIPVISIRKQGGAELRSDGTQLHWKTWNGDSGTLTPSGT